MRKRLLPAGASFLAFAFSASPQTQTETNPGHAPSVFMGGTKEKKDKAPTSRTLRGTVVDDGGRPMEGALVTLTNKSTNEKITFITKKDGQYRFDDLSFTTDYEVGAKYKRQSTEARQISQYDHRADVIRRLELSSEPAAAEAKK